MVLVLDGTNGLLVGVNARTEQTSIIYNGEDTPLIFYTKTKECVSMKQASWVSMK